MLSYDHLYQRVFDKNIDADQMVIITGYVGTPIVPDLKNLPYKVKLFIGMYGNDIYDATHKKLLEHNKIENIEIFYTDIYIHAKCYVWLKNNAIVKALIGSANFSTNGLNTPNKEILGDIPENSYDEMLIYIKMLESSSYPVNEYNGRIRSVSRYVDEITKTISDSEVEITLLATRPGSGSNIIGICTSPGEVPASSGLNWGFSNGGPNPNDAYIKIPIEQVQNNPQMFPPKNNESNEPIDVIWDDGTEMQMLLEGNQNIDNVDYPKQIGTYKNKSELGLYMRKRIGDALGIDLTIPLELNKEAFVPKAHYYKNKFITRDILEQYGRTSVNIKLIGDRTYYFDFSPKNCDKS